MKKQKVAGRFKKAVATELKESIKGTDKGDIALSQLLYALMNFGGGGGLDGLAMSQLISVLTVKATYDGHRYHKGDENFAKKRRHFFKNMYVGLAGGMVPRLIENIQHLAEQYDVSTLRELGSAVFDNIGDVIVMEGGPYNVYSLVAVLAFQAYGHMKHIRKEINNTLDT